MPELGRKSTGRNGGYYWDRSTLEQRRRTRLLRLESENYTQLPDFDKQTLATSKRSKTTVPNNEPPLRTNRKETRLLAMQRRGFADLLTTEMESNYKLAEKYVSCVPISNECHRHFCSVCGYWGIYTCIDCGMRYCCLPCKSTHTDTRCLKHVS
ncbi:hypothetical protein COEREDRAFT_83623 [Coemansia reversa NRRL 1564]|uniref:HIT-type domain-containing protein n=1 Tax=Coemansia reversa (strain ATCC 12441 / NRRL 1564) TaxID=763665 RepID=A0A2G5B2F5_COERN|nr:hypothetical protein COEREDRAFT_83623 [Coemansia reversa NRRL 1564]|eukprot:PIA13203.1 hypothetical protein COEREDRAFT_83623 [Coemansia reversa NRRL 1564]